MLERDLKGLLGYSELKHCKKHVFYGKDPILGPVRYDRRIRRENGFIVSDDYHWALNQAKQEINAYQKNPDKTLFHPILLADDAVDSEIFGTLRNTQSEDISLSNAPEWLQRAILMRWAVQRLSTNGRIMKRHLDMIKQALDDQKEALTIEAFLKRMGDQEQRVLIQRPLKEHYEVSVSDCNYGTLYQVHGDPLEKEIAYALIFSLSRGLVYSLNSELLSWKMACMFEPTPDSFYTFLSRTPGMVYENPWFQELLKAEPFLLVGEHRVNDKLKLSESAGLTKEQRQWISEPAKGSLLITKQVEYMLIRSKEGRYEDALPGKEEQV
jgi:hypothetical protein